MKSLDQNKTQRTGTLPGSLRSHSVQAIEELALLFGVLKERDEMLYIEALHSLAALAISQLRFSTASAIEREIREAGNRIAEKERLRMEWKEGVTQFPCRRKGDRRIF